MRWMRGGEENSAASAVMSAGMAEIDGLFRPSKHKQTEHVEESKRRRIDVANGADVDLERGVVVVRTKTGADPVDGRTLSTRPRTIYQPRPRRWWTRWTAAERHRRARARLIAMNVDTPSQTPPPHPQ
jgi:hypothetical protein